jgi:hypothetical protein
LKEILIYPGSLLALYWNLNAWFRMLSPTNTKYLTKIDLRNEENIRLEV